MTVDSLALRRKTKASAGVVIIIVTIYLLKIIFLKTVFFKKNLKLLTTLLFGNKFFDHLNVLTLFHAILTRLTVFRKDLTKLLHPKFLDVREINRSR